MMLKGRHAAGCQGAKAAPKGLLVASVPARRRPAAFQAASRTTRVAVRATAEPEAAPAPRRAAREVTVDLQQVSAGDSFTGKVTAVESYGAFINFGAEKDGLVHVSQLKDGFVGSVGDVVSVGDEVEVRVLSVDAATGKIALTMKGGGAAADEFGDAADAVDEGEEEEVEEGQEGVQLVYADEATGYSFPFVIEDDEGELTPEALVAMGGQDDLVIEHTTDLDLPVNELVVGKVSRVDAFGAYITVSHNGQEVECYMDRDEAKVPASALSAEDLAEFVGEGEPVPEYIDIVGEDILYEDDEDEDAREEVDDRYMFDDMTTYYKVGDQVKAFVLGFDTKREMMALTQFTDAEVQAGGLEALTEAILEEEADEEEGEGERRFRRGPRPGAEEEEDAEDDVPLSRLGDAEDFDALAFSPEELMEIAGAEEDGAEDDDDALLADMDGEAAEAVGEYKVLSRGLLGMSMRQRGIKLSDVSFPELSADAVDPFALQHVRMHETDFDGDVNELEDMWQETGLEVSRATWKSMNLKFQWGESGEAELVPREGAEEEEESDVNDIAELLAAGSRDNAATAAAWVALLAEEGDEGEAELPALAARRPLRV